MDIEKLILVYEQLLEIIDAHIKTPKSQEIRYNLEGRRAVYKLIIEDLKQLNNKKDE